MKFYIVEKIIIVSKLNQVRIICTFIIIIITMVLVIKVIFDHNLFNAVMIFFVE